MVSKECSRAVKEKTAAELYKKKNSSRIVQEKTAAELYMKKQSIDVSIAECLSPRQTGLGDRDYIGIILQTGNPCQFLRTL